MKQFILKKIQINLTDIIKMRFNSFIIEFHEKQCIFSDSLVFNEASFPKGEIKINFLPF